MTDVRRLTEDELSAFAAIAANAYPAFAIQTAEERQKIVERWIADLPDATSALYGAFREGTVVGGMRLHDFTMNVFGAQVPTGGVGMVATDLIHKKEHVAKDLIAFFLEHFRSRGTPLAALYPFRPDFYKQMGFGYGTKVNEYRVHPADLPGGERAHVAYLTTDDAAALAACYARHQARTHGLMQRPDAIFTRWLANPKNHFIGFRRDDRIEGYQTIRLSAPAFRHGGASRVAHKGHDKYLRIAGFSPIRQNRQVWNSSVCTRPTSTG